MTEAGRPVPDESDADPALDVLPDAYAEWRRSTLGRITDALEERLLLDRIGPARGLRILDVGCGDGVLATRLAQDGARVTGIDASADMLAAAHRRARAAGVDVDLVEGDAGNLPFPKGQFDCVVSVATLCFVEDARPTIREMVRVLKPGGRLILGELGRWNLWAVQRRVKGWLGSDLWRAAHFRSRAEMLALAAEAGLADASVTGAIFYPPVGLAAKAMAPLDHMIGRAMTMGAAFLVMTGTKPHDGKNCISHKGRHGMNGNENKSWLAPAATLLSLLTCYGTLAAIALLGALGVGIALNETVWAGGIVFFALLAVLALVLRWRRHGRTLPVGLGLAGLALIAFAMYVSYSLPVELAGFALLCAGTYADWRGGRA